MKEVSRKARSLMNERTKPGDRWAVYENHAMDSAFAGNLNFLQIGPTRTFKKAPERMPDSNLGIGWKYVFIGWVDLESGEILPKEEEDRCGSS